MHVELHVPSFENVQPFYEHLGFAVAWKKDADNDSGYLVMQYQNSALCFGPGNETVFEQPYFRSFDPDTPRGYGTETVIMTNELQDIHERAQKLGCVVEELKRKPWGLEDFRIADSYGYYIRFTEPHNVLIE